MVACMFVDMLRTGWNTVLTFGVIVPTLLLGSCTGDTTPVQHDGGDAVSNGDASPSGGDGDVSLVDGGGAQPNTSTRAGQLAAKLGKSHFLIGLGNDLNNDHDQDGAYTLGTTLDLHYAYLVGLLGQGGWPDWNADGGFVNILTDSAKRHGVTPMFTLYAMAAQGENNLGVLTNDAYMQAYWDGAILLYQRLAVFNDVALVQFEPDFWGYTQQASQDPSEEPVKVGSLAPDCAELPETMEGMGKCLVKLAREYAPKVLVGFHVSGWADPDAGKVASYLLAIGADQADFVTTDTLDRDAGCFEARVDPRCQRTGTFYWDETNTTSPNFRDHLAWAKQITTSMDKPMLWWQTPLGVPSSTPGGTAGHYRDNRVKYIFEHIDEFIEAGGVGAVFGTGASNQTDITTDGGQFRNAVNQYFSRPVAL